MATAIDPSSRGKAALLHFLTQVSMWYLFSVLFNIELKKYFNLYDSPFLITFANLFVACVASAATMGRAAIVEMQVEKMIRKLTIVGVFQFIGTLSTNLSISMMAVSFTHIVKAMEPIFTLAWIVLLAKYGFSSSNSTTISKSQLLAVMGVVVGVILASISESSYSLAGLLFGLLSNVSFAGRNVLLNSVMKDYKAGKEQVFLFSSLVGCVLSLILTLVFDAKYLSTLPASGYLSLFYISVMYFLYNLISFSVLEGVTPVTHAITNCCKRLVIVFVSLLAFHIIPSPLGLVGSLVTIFGVACYSLLRNMQSENPSVTMKTFRNVVLSFIFGAIVLYLVLMSATASSSSSSSSSSTAVFPTASPNIPDSEEVPSWVSAYGPRGNFNPFGNSDILAKLQDKVIKDFGPTFWNIKYAIFMGAPDYNNRGDSAIYIGSVYFLNLINIRIIHECAESLEWHCTWNVSQYVTKDGKSIVCLQGGGNMGDIYPYQEQKRLDYLKWAGYDKKVALFPQSIKFKNPRNWKRTEDAYNQVKEITMATRDEFSYEQMHEHFPNKKVILIPDMAFMIGHKQRAFPPKVDLLIFLRGDEERIKNLTVRYDYIPKGVSFKQNDWVQNDDAQAWDANTLYERCELRTYDAMHMLTEGKVVITDRLHAHVLTTLQDIPHVILDNSYGKVHGNHKLWTNKCKGIETAHSWEEAVDKAMVLLAQVNYYVYENEQLKL